MSHRRKHLILPPWRLLSSPGVGGDVSNSFDGETWRLKDVVDSTHD